MSGVDDIIKQWVAEAERTGEAKRLPGFGQPLNFEDGFLETPTELRMAYKVLKNAGYVPAEIAHLRDLATLREQLAGCDDAAERSRLRASITRIEVCVGMMMERLRRLR